MKVNSNLHLIGHLTLDWEDMGLWPRYIKTLVCVLVFGLGGVVGYVIWIKPTQALITHLQKQHNETQAQVAEAAFERLALASVMREREVLKAELAAKHLPLSVDKERADVVVKLEQAARLSQVRFSKFTWKDRGQSRELTNQPDGALEHAFELVLEGNYHQIAQFFNLVGSFDSYLVTDQFVMDLNDGRLTLALFGGVYVWPDSI